MSILGRGSRVNEALKKESQIVKALYRRAAAEFSLEGFQECIRHCTCGLGIDPQHTDDVAREGLVEETQELEVMNCDSGRTELRGTARQAHAEKCRNRMETELKGTAKADAVHKQGDCVRVHGSDLGR